MLPSTNLHISPNFRISESSGNDASSRFVQGPNITATSVTRDIEILSRVLDPSVVPVARDGGLASVPTVDVDGVRERTGEGGPVVISTVEPALGFPGFTPDGDGSFGATNRVVSKNNAEVAAGLRIVSQFPTAKEWSSYQAISPCPSFQTQSRFSFGLE